MRLLFKLLLGLVSVAVLGAQAPPTGTERIARQAGIDLEIVGSDHPELPDFKDGYKNHGAFTVNFKGGGINFARLDRGDELIQKILVFYRNWRDEQPLDARAVGCPANAYLALDDPAQCFRAIVGKMEGGRGPVRLEIRFYYGTESLATIPVNTVQIPWPYIKRYAEMESTE